MFPPPWKSTGRLGRRTGPVDCRASNLSSVTRKPSSSRTLSVEENSTDTNEGSPRLAFNPVLRRDSTEGEVLRFTINGKRDNKRKRAGKRACCDTTRPEEPSVALSCSSSTTSAPRNPQTTALPDLSSWRNKLLLHALRETGEEMKRRRQTLKEVRARHAAENEQRGRSGCGPGGRAADHGRRKPGLSRRTLTNLAETSCSVQQTGNVSAIRRGTNNRQSCVTVSSASPETDEEEGGGDEEESSDQRGANKRVKRRAPKGNRQRGASVVGGGGGHNVDHEDVTLRSGGMRCDSVQHDSTVAVLAAAASGAGLKINVGLPVREDSADVGSVTRVLLQASVDVTMADGGAGRAKVCGKVGERFSGRGSNIGDGGTAVIPISRVLPVLNSRLGAQTATAEQAEPVWSRSRKATLARKSRLRSVASTKQPAVVASVRGAVKGIRVATAQDGDDAEIIASIVEKGPDDQTKGNLLELRHICGAPGADVAAGEADAEPMVGQDPIAVARTKQEPPPAPFRGTFWDEDDGPSIFSRRRGSHDAQSDETLPVSSTPGKGMIAACDSTVVQVTGGVSPGNDGGMTPPHVSGSLVRGSKPGKAQRGRRGALRTIPAVVRPGDGDGVGGFAGAEATLPDRCSSASSSVPSSRSGAGSGATGEIVGRSALARECSDRGKEDSIADHGRNNGTPDGGLYDGGLGKKALAVHTKSEDNRRQFFQLYRRMARQVEIVGDTGALSEEGRTPRQEFIRRILSMGRLPVPILLRNPSALQDLNLAHRGLGDDVMCATAEVLTRLPNIRTLNVADNRLTDRSLCPMCALVVEMPGLKSLDLSSNKVDEAAAIIRGYLAHPSCSLQTLSLRSADVDDNECCDLMAALSKNASLTRLDISENKIGENEMLNTVQPDLITGGEAIATMLEGNAALQNLDVSWNNLRQESAAAIGRSLCLNRGLKSLNLAHNAFNDTPSQEVGDSLRVNETLKHLDLSYNGLTPAAAIVIASACKANVSLTRLTLNGNRLGRQGSAALLGAIRKRRSGRGSRKPPPLLLGLEGCDCESDSQGLFDVAEPTGEYKLDMSLPYSRMLASELVTLSEAKKGFEIEGIWCAKDMASLEKPERRERVKVEREVLTSSGRLRQAGVFTKAIAEIAKKAMDASKLSLSSRSGSVLPQPLRKGAKGGPVVATHLLNGYERSRAKEQMLKLLEAVDLMPSRSAMEGVLDEVDWGWIMSKDDVFHAIFTAAFRVYDKDSNDALKRQELLELFKGIGCAMDEQRCKALVSVYDIDSSGALETEEFVAWMMLEHIREPESWKGRLMEVAKSRPWRIPREGAYLISFRASRFPGDLIHVESAEGLQAMVENIKHMNTATERLRMFENAAMNTDMMLTARQAVMLAALVDRDEDRIVTAEKLLGLVVNPDERFQFLESFLDQGQKLRLAVRMRGLYRAVMGNPTGFYTLDLGNPQGRRAAIKLEEMANAERLWTSTNGVRDTSQKGNRTPFRNEVMDTVRLNVNMEWFVRLPRRGTIRMDVVSSIRPRLSVRPMSEARFGALKTLLDVDGEMAQIKGAYDLLDQQRANATCLRTTQHTNAGHGRSPRHAVAVLSRGSSRDLDAQSSTYSEAESTLGGGGGDGAGGKSGSGKDNTAVSRIVAPYHYDASTIFRARDPAKEAPVPKAEVPDCIKGVIATDQWQQYRASSHYFLDYVEAAKRQHNSAANGVGGGGVVGVETGGGEGRSGAGGGGPVGLSSGLTVKSPGGTADAGDRVESKLIGPSVLAGPTRLYRLLFHRLMVLQTAACAAWYTCEQAFEVASAFPWQDLGRVQAIVAVFSRIVDVERFSEVVLSVVREEEKRELEHRLGLLKVLSPLRPDGPYELDLSSWEEREWAKILIKLAVEEPGANWGNEFYTHSRGTPSISGWLLPESWTREDEEMRGEGGPRRTGVLGLRYITDASIGCIAKWDVRKALQARTMGGLKREL